MVYFQHNKSLIHHYKSVNIHKARVVKAALLVNNVYPYYKYFIWQTSSWLLLL